MNTLVLVLSSFVGQAPEAIPAPTWQRDYTHAQHMAMEAKKPLAVFLAPGQDGLTRLVQGGLSPEAKGVLAQKYISVLVDTTTPEGQRLANAFQLRAGQGLIISDKGGAYQAYWLQGTLTNQDLVRSLERYANQTEVRVTEIAGRPSFYPPMNGQVTQGGSIRQVNAQGQMVYYDTMPTEGRRFREGRRFNLLGRFRR